VSSCWPYTHDKFEDEVFTKNAQYWNAVVARMEDPKMTRFKSMSLDEQTVILEQTGQEALRAREEMIATKIAEIPLVAPIQERNVHEAQDAQERGLLMYE
jgi:hypothetical protein